MKPNTIIPLVLILLLLLPSQTQASAPLLPTQQDTAPGIDLIVLLDQSGSMSGSQGVTTDPANRRVYTTQYLIDYLAFDNNFVNSQRVNRVVVISFGSREKASLDVPLTSLKNEADVTAAKDRVEAKNLGDTNFVSAFQIVRDVFPEATDADIVAGKRQRIIVVITDGGPYDDRKLTLDGYFSEIRDVYINKLRLAEHFPLFVIGVDDAGLYWPVVGPRWQSFAAEAERVENINQVNQYIADQLCALLNPDGFGGECRLQEIGDHFVPPYVRAVAFSFFKYQENATITLKRADGTLVNKEPADSDLVDYQSTPRDELYVLSNPRSGCWLSAREGAGRVDVDVVSQVIFNDLRITQPSSVHSQALPLKLVFELRDEQGLPIDEDPNFPITIQGRLVGPDGNEQVIDIGRAVDDSGNTIPGKYESRNIPELAMAGDYQLTVLGSTTALNAINTNCLTSAEPIRIFQNHYVIPVVQPSLVIQSPTTPWLQYSAIKDLIVSFADDSGKPLYYPQDSPWSIDLSARSPSGQDLDLPDGQWQDGSLTVRGPILLDETGQYVLTAIVKNAAGQALTRAQAMFQTAVHLDISHPGPEYPLASEAGYVRVIVQDTKGKPYTTRTDYPLTRLEAQLLSPQTTSADPIELRPTGNPAEFAAEVPWMLPDEVVYILHIRGYVELEAGQSELVFDYPFDIRTTSELPRFVVVDPVQGQTLGMSVYPLHQGVLPLKQSMPIRVDVYRGEEPVAPADVFSSDVNNLVSVTVIGPTAQSSIENQVLKISPDKQYLYLEIPKLTAEGEYEAHFTFQGEVKGQGTPAGAWPAVTLAFERRDPEWVLWVWRVLIALVELAAVSLLAYIVMEKVALPKVKGTLIAEESGIGGKEIAQFPLQRQNRHTVILGDGPWIRLGLAPKSELTKLGLTSLTVMPAEDQTSTLAWRLYAPPALIAAVTALLVSWLLPIDKWAWVWFLPAISIVGWGVVLIILRNLSTRQIGRQSAQNNQQRYGVSLAGRDLSNRNGAVKGVLYNIGGQSSVPGATVDRNKGQQPYRFKLK